MNLLKVLLLRVLLIFRKCFLVSRGFDCDSRYVSNQNFRKKFREKCDGARRSYLSSEDWRPQGDSNPCC